MVQLMRCLYCGLLQDEPLGVKECRRCGGELTFEKPLPADAHGNYLHAQMELDQVSAPAGQTIDRHLLVTLRTPKEVPPQQAAVTETGRPPINFSAVLDVSGSMHGDKLYNMKEAIRQALRFLRKEDMVSIVTFANQPNLIQEPTKVDTEVLGKIEYALQKMNAGGMTSLDGGLQMGIGQALRNRLDSNLLLLLSDGQTNVGETDIERIGMRSSQARESELVISTMGLGSDYNEALLTEIAVQGGGRYYHVQSSDQIVSYLTGELGEAADLAARDVQIHIQLPHGAVLVPFSAAYKASLADGRAVVSIGDIPADLEIEIPLRLTLYAGEAGTRLSLDGEVIYRSPAGNRLSTPLNRVTVRFVSGKAFQLYEGVVTPVVERIAGQMRAAQILQYARATARGIHEEVQKADREQAKVREYFGLLGKEKAELLTRSMDQDLHHLREASPAAKNVQASAYKVNRFMRDLDKK